MIDDYPLTPKEKKKIKELKSRFYHKVDLYYSLPWNHKERARIYDEAVALLDERLYIIMGV